MDYCTITPTRGDRPQLLAFCKHQLDRMSEGRPSFVIDYKPKSVDADLVPRIKVGLEMAKKEECEYVFIVEDDDYYPSDYLRSKVLDFDFFGYRSTTYYNLRNNTYATYQHRDRSSLFCTGFKVAALDRFTWPSDHSVFLDLEIWDYAIRNRKKIILEDINPCVGIKHNLGKTGGKAHRWEMNNWDKDRRRLSQMVDQEAFEFYKSLKL